MKYNIYTFRDGQKYAVLKAYKHGRRYKRMEVRTNDFKLANNLIEFLRMVGFQCPIQIVRQ